MPKQSSNNISNCSIKGVANKFKQLGYVTNISHTVSTGNKTADKYIAKTASKVINTVVKDPRLKSVIKASKTVYLYVEKGGANIARGIAAYRENCRKK